MDDFTHFLFETGLIIDVTEDKNNKGDYFFFRPDDLEKLENLEDECEEYNEDY